MDSSSHTCQGLVVHCIDFRFRPYLHEFLKGLFPSEDYDLVADAGGVKDLADESEGKQFLLRQLDISVQLHNPQLIALIQHEDCGAYGGSLALGSSEEEFAFHSEQLQKAAKVLRGRFPGKLVQCYFMRLSGEVAEVSPPELAQAAD